jgi:hypothetical protein
MNPGLLPPSFLRCLSPSDRKSLGKAGMTPEEAIAKQEVKSERDLQQQIANLLRLRNIEFFWQRMDKRTTGKVGQPDFIFSVLGTQTIDGEPLVEGYSVAWEAKLPTGELSIEQSQMAIRLQSPPNNWHWRIIRSVDEALSELKAMGL